LGEYAVVRNVTIGASDMNKAAFKRWKTSDLPTVDDQINAVLSSSAIPMFFPHNDWDNSSYSDGGLMHMIDLQGGIEHCLDMGYA